MRQIIAAICCVVLGFAVAILWIGYAIYYAGKNADWADLANHGEYWGAVINGGLSWLSAMLFLAALLLQQKELSAQRIELARSHEIAQEQSNQLAKQVEQLAHQAIVAEKAAVIAAILDLVRLRDQLMAEKITATQGRGDLNAMIKDRLVRISPQMIALLQSPCLAEEEKLRLTAAVGPWGETESGQKVLV